MRNGKRRRGAESVKSLDAETLRGLMNEKDRELSEEAAALMLAAEITEAGSLAPSNDLYRRPRLLRKAAKSLYLKAYRAGIIRAGFTANK